MTADLGSAELETTVQAGQQSRTFASGFGGWTEFQPEPRFELGFDGRVRTINAAARSLLVQGAFALADGRLRFGAQASQRALDRAIARAANERPIRRRVVLRRLDGAWQAADLHAEPGSGTALLALRPTGEPSRDDMAAVAEAFDLTPAEAQVLRSLVLGRCAKEIARDQDISEHTVRSHLRSLYSKLGVRGLSNAICLAVRLIG